MDKIRSVSASPLSRWVVSRRKRLLDRLAAAAMALPAIALLAPLVAWSACSFRANPIFLQRRIGLSGRAFSLIKLRTLPASTPNALDRAQLEAEYEAGGVAGFLRKSHLDELPQVLQVLSGQMSLVGPRPMIQPIVDNLLPEFRTYRQLVRPGLTGLWQISAYGEQVFEEYDPLDVAYLETASPMLDLKILLRTIWQVLGGKRLGPEQIEKSLGVAVHVDVPTVSSAYVVNTRAEATGPMIHPSYRVI